MSEITTESKLFNLLRHMIQDHDRYFEKETAQYIIDRLPFEELMQPKYATSITNFSIQSNFFGMVLMKNSYYINDADEKQSIQEWKEILEKKDPRLVEYPEIVFIPTNTKDQTPKFKEHLEIKADFSTYYALHHMSDWLKALDSELFGHKLRNINKAVFTIDSICEDQYSTYYPFSKNKVASSENIDEFLINIIIDGKEEVIKNKWHDDKSFTNKVFHSKRMKLLMKYVEPESIEKLFTTDSLSTIIKQANSHESIKNSPKLLGNLLALAPAEKWMDGWAKQYKAKSQTINIVDLFNNKFHGAYGINITNVQKAGTKKEQTFGKSEVQDALRDEMEFFLPAISKLNPDKEQICHMFIGLMKSRDVDLLKSFMEYFEIPNISPAESEKNAELAKAYNKMMAKLEERREIYYEIKDDKGEVTDKVRVHSWKEVCADLRARKLDAALNKKEQVPVKRTLKI